MAETDDPALAVCTLTVIVVSYNTRDLTLAALRTLYATTRVTVFRTVVIDNASTDGSADAIALAFPQIQLIRSTENLGFARANNVVGFRELGDCLWVSYKHSNESPFSFH